MTNRGLQEKQVGSNYEEFVKQLPKLRKSHPGKYALMRDAKVIDFFDTPRDAYIAGKNIFSDDMIFSIQKITEMPVDLGFFSHALSKR